MASFLAGRLRIAFSCATRSNLVLLCRPHHRLAHVRFRVELADGRPTFTRPDGARLEDDRAPP